MPSLPSLELLAAEVTAEVAAQERRGDALDSKAGIILGFAGVIVGLTVQNLHSALGDAGLLAGAAAALAAGVAFIPRSFPTIEVLHLRQAYLTSDVEFTRLRLLDTRIAMYQHSQRLLRRKARLVTVATAALGLAVILTVVGAILG